MRTKLARDDRSKAVHVAESVSHALLAAHGFCVAQAFCVVIDEKFATSLTAQYEFTKAVLPGRHWGTKYLHSTQGVAFAPKYVPYLKQPLDLVRLYLADVILANRDRDTHGNVLLTSHERTRSDIIPIDQSDAFFGPCTLLDREALRKSSQKPGGLMLDGAEPVIFDQDPQTIEQCFDEAKRLLPHVGTFIDSCPEEWIAESDVDTDTLRTFIEHRICELDVLARKDHYLNIAAYPTGEFSVQLVHASV